MKIFKNLVIHTRLVLFIFTDEFYASFNVYAWGVGGYQIQFLFQPTKKLEHSLYFSVRSRQHNVSVLILFGVFVWDPLQSVVHEKQALFQLWLYGKKGTYWVFVGFLKHSNDYSEVAELIIYVNILKSELLMCVENSRISRLPVSFNLYWQGSEGVPLSNAWFDRRGNMHDDDTDARHTLYIIRYLIFVIIYIRKCVGIATDTMPYYSSFNGLTFPYERFELFSRR